MAKEKPEKICARIKNYGIIPAIKTVKPEDSGKAVRIAEALVSSGLNIACIISTEENAAETIAEISAGFPDMLLIAGNIMTEQQAKSASDSGAKAVMLRGPDENLKAYCAKNNIAVIPECPCADDIENLVSCLSDGSVAACAADFIVGEEYLNNGEFDKISEAAALAVQKMLGFDLAHVVINCENTEQADRDASKIESIFGLKKTDAGASISNADILHFMKSKSYGKNGQIAISSNFIDRAVFYLKEAGKEFIEESARFDGDGRLTSIFLDNIVGGFAFKLVRK